MLGISGMESTKSKPFETGFVVGKFIPLHLGHIYLLSTAQRLCDTLLILSYTSDDRGFGATERNAALNKHFPNAKIAVLNDGVPDDNDDPMIHRKFCADKIVELGWGVPDAVFTSEDYGDGLAQYFSEYFDSSVKHVCVDKDRLTYPVSATKIRNGELDYKTWTAM